MPHITNADAPTFALEGATFTGLAAPSRGAKENAVWRVTIAPETPATPHELDREETFVVIAGQARATIGAETHHLAPGDALVVPPHHPFALANEGSTPFEAVVVFPVGGRAVMPGGEPFTPPWAE